MASRIFFMHVQKTAGTSVTTWLGNHFAPERRMPLAFDPWKVEGADEESWTNEEEFKAGVDRLRQYDLVAGHFDRAVWEELGSEWLSMVILREPRARVISHYRMMRGKSTNVPARAGELRDLAKQGLLPYLRSGHPAVQMALWNGQVRQLSKGRKPLVEPFGQPVSKRGMASLRQAIDAIERMDVVGVTEMLGVTLQLLCVKMGWSTVGKVPRLGSYGKPSDEEQLTEEERHALDEATCLDQKLYRAALARLDRDMAESFEKGQLRAPAKQLGLMRKQMKNVAPDAVVGRNGEGRGHSGAPADATGGRSAHTLEAMAPRIFFMHVPKTAGTSVTTWLAERFPADRRMPLAFEPWSFDGRTTNSWRTPEEFKKGVDRLRQFDLVSAHFRRIVWEELGDEWISLVILREPRARVVSHYKMVRNRSDAEIAASPPRAGELRELARKGLVHYLRSGHPAIERALRNGQVRQLSCGKTPLVAPYGQPSSDTAEASLREALETVEKMSVVGVTEMLGATLRLLCDRAGWENVGHIPEQARSSKPSEQEELTDEELQALDEMTNLDQKLYRAALTRLDRDISGQLDQGRLGLLGEERSGPNVLPPIAEQITMDGPAPGVGWHVREGPPERYVRWTGPERQSTVRFRLSPTCDHRITLELTGFMSPDILQGMHLLVDGTSVPLVDVGPSNGLLRFSAHVPAWCVRAKEPTPVSLLVPRTLSHEQLDPRLKDPRQKGVAVHAISATPLGPDRVGTVKMDQSKTSGPEAGELALAGAGEDDAGGAR